MVKQGSLAPMFLKQQIYYSWDLADLLVGFVPLYFCCIAT
jgi:hypothetical protein